MNIIIESPEQALWNNRRIACAVGRGGIVDADMKREGDGATPRGRWPMREVFFRADRLTEPATLLPIRPLDPMDGWCEKTDDVAYNKLVRLPYPAAVDRMWREDPIYDLVVVLGYNDDPVKPGAGSAIFLHLARPDFSPSAGCVVMRQEDLLFVLREADKSSCVIVR